MPTAQSPNASEGSEFLNGGEAVGEGDCKTVFSTVSSGRVWVVRREVWSRFCILRG